MSGSRPERASPAALHDRAADNLRFIRDTMARAAEFTAVPGWGGAAMGVTALAAAAVSGPPREDRGWLGLWLGEAALAVLIGLIGVAAKARWAGVPLGGAAARRFTLAFIPSLAAGAVMTAVLVNQHLARALPGTWLLLYGAAVTSGGALSVRVVPLLGVSCMALGVAAFASPSSWGHLYMAAGFGVMQVVCGLVIARRYGG